MKAAIENYYKKLKNIQIIMQMRILMKLVMKSKKNLLKE